MSDTSTRLWASLFVLLVFVSGFAAGVVVRPWLAPGPGPPPAPGPRGLVGGPSPDRMTERLLERISVDIDLTREQDQRLRAVFDGRRQQLREVAAAVGGQFEIQQAEMNAEIAAILTPDQMEIFENEIVRMRRRRGGPPGRGGLWGRPRRGPGPPP
jgi:Spy/CpxP family protein refolding chaperone